MYLDNKVEHPLLESGSTPENDNTPTASPSGKTRSSVISNDFITKESYREKDVKTPRLNPTTSEVTETQEAQQPNCQIKNKGTIRFLLTLIIVDLPGQILYMNTMAQLPIFIKSNYPEVNTKIVGMLLSMYPVTFLLTAFCSNYILQYGRKRAIVLGIFILTVVAAVYALAGFIQNNFGLFYTISIMARLCQGVGDSILCVTIPSLIAIYWPVKTEVYLSYFNASVGFGLCFGPMLASIINQFLNYSNTFFFFTGLFAVLLLVAIYVIPESANSNFIDQTQQTNNNHIQDNEATIGQEAQKETDYSLSFLKFLTNLKVLQCVLIAMSGILILTFSYPYLGPYLTTLGVPKENVTLVFSAIGAAYMIGNPIVGWLCQKISRVAVIQIGMISYTLALTIYGPVKFLPISDDSIIHICAGIAMLSFSLAFLYTPVYPMMIEAMEQRYPDPGYKGVIADKCSALKSVAFSSGSIVAPIIGGYFYDQVGFQTTATIMMFYALTLALLFFVFVGLPFWRSKSEIKVQ